MNTNQYFCYRIKKKIHPCLKMVEVLTNSCKIFKNKTLPARQFHIWEHGSASHILAHKVKFPHSQKPNDNSTLLFLSGGSSLCIKLQPLSSCSFKDLSPPQALFVFLIPYYFLWTQLFSGKRISLYIIALIIMKISHLKYCKWHWWQKILRDTSK